MMMESKPSILSPLALPTLVDWVVVLMLVMAFASLADWRRQNPGQSFWLKHDQSDHIGAEYDTIAQAIRHGRGFSDPFHDSTGPTAWMPPVLVYWTAAIYAVCGDNREYVVEIIVACSLLVVILVSTLVVGQGRRLSCPKTGFMILALYLMGDFFDLFQMTHDTWLILFVLGLLWLGVAYLIQQPSSVSLAWKWGLLGGFAALCSPIIGFAWAALTTWLWFPWRTCKRMDDRWSQFKPLLLAAVVSIVIVTPWMIRNRVMLGKWIPVKSNAVYEIWQAQVLDNDGVLDTASAWQHPWGSDGSQRARYKEVGEIEFIAERWPVTAASIRSDPFEFATRIVNRWFAACLYYTPLSPEDETMRWSMYFKRLIFPLPFLSLFVILWLRRGPLEPEVLATIGLYVVYLGPYIAISYYDRYAAPLVLCKSLLVLYAVDTVHGRVVKFKQLAAMRQHAYTHEATHAGALRLVYRSGFTLIELIVVIAIIGILVSLAGPAVQQARGAARRMECQNRIRQLGLGVELFHGAYQIIPSNGGPESGNTLQLVSGPNLQPFTEDIVDGTHYNWGVGDPARAGKQQTGSWAYSILPYIEQEAAYRSGSCAAPQPLFACPSRPRGNPVPPLSSPLVVFESGGVAMTKTDFCANNRLSPNRPHFLSYRDVLDGLSQTILIGEKAIDPVVQTDASWYWDEPIWLGGSKGTARSGLKILPDRVGIEFKENWGSAHDGGALFVFADNHVQFITHSADWQLLAASLSPRGGEPKTLAE